MNEFVRPEVVYEVPTQVGELQISNSHDFLHHWRRNGAWMLKYLHNSGEGLELKNIVLAEVGARWLIEHCGVEVCEREFMSPTEYSHYVEFQAMTSMADFEAEFTGDGYDDIIEQ